MLLTSTEINAAHLIAGGVPAGQRDTTYDATVGCIIQEGKEISPDSFTLIPRGIVWVVSAEKFCLPSDITGLATLRTTWTHDGILALNVGVVDPGWNGPLAAALVNFSNRPFPIRKGDTFLRVLFFNHNQSAAKNINENSESYKLRITKNSCSFAETFLDMKKLSSEVALSVFGLPKFVFYVTIILVALGIFSVFSSMAYGLWFDKRAVSAEVEVIAKRTEAIESSAANKRDLEKIEYRMQQLELLQYELEDMLTR